MSEHSSFGPNPLELLPLTDPRCDNDSCTAFEAAHNLSQATVSYALQFEYGHWTTWYYIIIIFIFTLANILRLWLSRTASQPRAQSTLQKIWSKSVAAGRYLSYRRGHGKVFDRLGLPSLGVLALLLLSVLFICILTFAVRPYYRQHRGYGSPPIAIRTGLMAAACLPLLVALAGKANFISLLTGIGHERLNVLHRWVGWICLGLGIVHTIPFIVAPLREGGPAALYAQYYEKGAFEYMGTPALGMLVGLTVLSIPFIRHRFYESFYILHILLYVTYLGLCFWHFGNEGDSWAYLWATLAIFLATLLGRVFWFNRSFNVKGRWIVASNVEVLKMQGEMTKLEVWPMPTGLSWRPGQHCFLRFPGLETLGNHPFTIGSADLRERHYGEKASNNELEHDATALTFYIRTHLGFTRKLAAYAAKVPDASALAWVEGPYGGLNWKIENIYDNIVLVAGGGGMTACLPWMEFLVSNYARGEKMRIKTVKFIWIVREAAHLIWISNRLQELDGMLAPSTGFLESQLFVTNQGHSSAGEPVESKQDTSLSVNLVEFPVRDDGAEKNIDAEDRTTSTKFTAGRPHMKNLLPDLVRPQCKTIVLGCGPESLKIDLSNVCANLQTSVLAGQIQELALHTETFGW